MTALTTTTTTAPAARPRACMEADAARLTWPAERLYWAVLEAPGWRTTGPLPPGLLPELEDQVPEPPGTLHAVCTPLSGGDGAGRVLVCAARRDALAELPPAMLALHPAGLPPCIRELIGSDAAGNSGDEGGEHRGDEEPRRLGAALNLLVGPFEPRPLRSARLRRHLAAAATLALLAALLAAGLARRASHWNSLAGAAAAQRHRLASEHVPSPAAAALPQALAAEAARLREGLAGAARIAPAPDAALALTDVLRAWPADAAAARPLSLVASGPGASLEVAVEGDPAPFLRALALPEGWSLADPRLTTSGATTRVSLALSRTALKIPSGVDGTGGQTP